eukprot:gnl/Chilomastix_caulleri/6054.p1 GENE.gnl/Chilomastix_caulleri/6054~~gnl/Chilomastix_caulleri/6054.p1  ORF type:complete len:55 (+),score=10.83 gnl/Chilomastix_caulleri/6054:130-294(+)
MTKKNAAVVVANQVAGLIGDKTRFVISCHENNDGCLNNTKTILMVLFLLKLPHS